MEGLRKKKKKRGERTPTHGQQSGDCGKVEEVIGVMNCDGENETK